MFRTRPPPGQTRRLQPAEQEPVFGVEESHLSHAGRGERLHDRGHGGYPRARAAPIEGNNRSEPLPDDGVPDVAAPYALDASRKPAPTLGLGVSAGQRCVLGGDCTAPLVMQAEQCLRRRKRGRSTRSSESPTMVAKEGETRGRETALGRERDDLT